MKKVLSNSVTVFLVVAAAALMILQGFNDNLLPEGAEAPAFEFEMFGGGRVASADLKGQVVLVDFWATWCPPCRAEMPWLIEVADEYKSKGVTFVAASHDDPEDRVAAIAAYAKKDAPGLERYAAFGDPFIGGKFRVESLPTLYVIGKDGKIAAAVKGQTSEWRVRRWLNAALAKEPEGARRSPK